MFENIINNSIKKASSKSVSYAEGDYYAPFLGDKSNEALYCGVCNTPKEYYPYRPDNRYYKSSVPNDNTVVPPEHRIYLFEKNGKPAAVPCKCKCDTNSYKAMEQRGKLNARIAENMLNCWGYSNNGVFTRNKGLECITFDTQQDNAHITKARGYIGSLDERLKEGKGIMFCGKEGAGKTVAAMCLANAIIKRGYDVLFKQQLEITRLSPYDDKQELSVLESCAVLFIDDFNPAAVGNFKRDMLQSLIDLRQKRHLVTCYTSTMTKQEFAHPQKQSDKPLFERVTACTYIVEDSTHNYRTEAYQSK